jgi:hypothetical protein
MTQSSYSLRTAREPGRSGVHREFRSIDATYYDVTDPDGWPIAGLLVLLDGSGSPVRSELYLYEGADVQAHEMAIRQARLLLQNRYIGKDPEGEMLELRISQARQLTEVLQVPLQGGMEMGALANWRDWLPLDRWPLSNTMTIVAAAAALFLVVASALAVPALLRSGGEGADAGTAALTTAPQQPAAAASIEDAAAPAVQPVDADQAAPASDIPLTAQTNGLPPSVNARDDLSIGQRVRIRPPLMLTLRSQPDPTAGEDVGYMENGQEAVIVGGPVWKPGNTDTIVWWYVRLDDGTEAWAAANTSELTLLEPVE